MAFDMSNYVDVAERLKLALEKWGEGLRIQCDPPKVVTINDRTFIEVTTRAWRTPDDPLPSVATAWEPFPGQTTFTKNSEMMNCETSSLGRCLGMMGVGVRNSIATSNEVRNRQNDREDHPTAHVPQQRVAPDKPKPETNVIPIGEKVTGGGISTAQKNFVAKLVRECKLESVGDMASNLLGRDINAVEDLTTREASLVIKALTELKEALQ
jgi:hypothetical protein